MKEFGMRVYYVSAGLPMPLLVPISAWNALDRALLGVISAMPAPALPLTPSRGAPPSGPARAADGPGPSRGGASGAFLGAEEAVRGGNQTQALPAGMPFDPSESWKREGIVVFWFWV